MTDEAKTLTTAAEVRAAFKHGDIIQWGDKHYASGKPVEFEVLYTAGGMVKFVPLPEDPLARERRAKRKPEE